MTPIQGALYSLVQYCKENHMKINADKTKVAIFNRSRKFEFLPQLSIECTTKWEVVEEF